MMARMAMPRDLVLVRHGESEANVVQRRQKNDAQAQAPEGFYDHHDSRVRLSDEGWRQAMVTGEWLSREFPTGFDRYYTSSLTRTIETAGRLGLKGRWNIDDRWRERDWGEYAILSRSEQETQFTISSRLKSLSRWYWRPPGGESLATGVRLRFEDILGTLHREFDDRTVIAVTHGEFMEVARFVIERLLPEEWQRQEQDERYKLWNCQILHYSRRDPTTGIVGERVEWRRSICAWDDAKSWRCREWTHLKFRKYDDDQLLRLVDIHPTLLSE